jgi:arsenite oxidase small subunit
MESHSISDASDRPCLSRRQFFVTGSKALATSVVLLSVPGLSDPLRAQVARYPKKMIAELSRIQLDLPIHFSYPFDHPVQAASMLVKLGTPAGGGVGPEGDIVAFSTLCTHMGGPLQATYKPAHKALGACPFHLSTYDLTRHGIIIAGHATQSLPQITLEVEGGNIFATGVMGLIYGRPDNLGI